MADAPLPSDLKRELVDGFNQSHHNPLTKRALEQAIVAGKAQPEHLPPVRLDPILWAPDPIPAKPDRDPLYLAYRKANRPFRRAFGGGEGTRKILLAVGTASAQRKDAQA